MAQKPTFEQLQKKIKRLEAKAATLKESQQALHESKERFSQIVQQSTIPTFVIDDQHFMTHCNRAFEALTGLHGREVIGTRTQWMAFYDEERPVLADFIVDGVSEEELTRYYGEKCKQSSIVEGAYEAEDFFPAFGENGKWLYVTAAPLLDDEGNITGALETLQDVSERRLAEEALRESEIRYRTLLNFAPLPIVVYTLDGRVSYLNPAFTEIFGWTLGELEGKTLDNLPPGQQGENSEKIWQILKDNVIRRLEGKRLTKDGRILDVIFRATMFSISNDEPAGFLMILRDVTDEKRIAQSNEAMLRISMALPEYPALDDLLTFINREVKRLLDTEGAIVLLKDEKKQELFICGASYDDSDTQKRMKEIRFSMDQLAIAGQVIRSGEPMIFSDLTGDPALNEARDRLLGYRTRNLILVPLKSSDRVIGLLCGVNKKEGHFDQKDIELLEMIAGTVALSIENAHFAEEVRKAYMEVTSLNRAKDKVINHLSHELRTPVAILDGSLDVLSRRLPDSPEERWKPTMARIRRNLERIVDIQQQVHDIMENKHYKAEGLLSLILDECADELETLIAQEIGERPVIEKIRKRVDEIFGTRESVPKELNLNRVMEERLAELKQSFSHRQVEIITRIDETPTVFVPPDVLQKVIDGLIKNAVENTPDEGKIEITVRQKGEGTELVVHDYGVGITEDAQRRIFEGFFSTQETLAYSSKRPFDFNAGGKGADLLRMKIFSERYHFNIEMTSSRCRYLQGEADVCPGRISKCRFCADQQGCHTSGGTFFTLNFPPVPGTGMKTQS